jgi:sporulation protein YlmC with PRC-barrel domain
MKASASLAFAASILGICSWAYPQEPRTTDPARQDPMRQGDKDATKSQVSSILKASDLIGKKVVNPEGKTLGDIKNLAIDAESGRVAYGILSFGGFLGIGDKLFAIPWGALRVGPGGDNFILNVAKEKLEKAPGFDSDMWPDLTNRKTASELHTYYGIPPYWEDAHFKGVVQPGRDVADAAYKDTKGFNPQTVETVNGRVQNVNRDAPEGAFFNLEVSGSEICKVVLGPATHLQAQNFELRGGDEVTVKGSKVTMAGQKVILATEVKKGDKTLRLRDEKGTPLWTTDKRDDPMRRDPPEAKKDSADPMKRDR